MTLAEVLEDRFRGDIRFRGAAYLQAERVAITRVTPDEVFAVVRDGVEHQTHLRREDERLQMFCNCARGGRPESTCKHVWATILAVDAGQYLTGTPSAARIPPFAAEPAPPPFGSDWDDDDLGDDDDLSSTGTRRAVLARRRIAAQPLLRPWESKLQDLHDSMSIPEAATAATGPEREVFYEIDAEGSREAGQVLLQSSQRQRRSNGQWGKLKPLKLRGDRLHEIEREEDRRILAYLTGGTPERNTWYAQQAESQGLTHRYRLPFELCELLLPLMCATARVRWLDDDRKAPESLKWDDGPAWELSLVVRRSEDESAWRLDGRLVRGKESLALKNARLVVPGGLVFTDTAISHLRDFDAFAWVPLLSRGEPVEVPAGEEGDLVDRLFAMPALPRLDLPEELRLEEVTAEPVPRLSIRTPRHRWQPERLQGEVEFEYLGTGIRGTSADWAIVQREQRRCIIRDRAKEEAAWSQLQETGFRRLLDRRRGGHDVEISARDLGPAVRRLVAEGWQVQADGRHVRQSGDIRFRVQSGIDWFELHGEADFEGRSVSFPELLAALARGDSTVRLDDGSLGILPEEWLERYGLLAGLGVGEENHVRFAANQVALLDALLASQPEVDFDQKFADLRQRFHDFSGVHGADEPPEFHGELRSYQREGLGWLRFLQEFQFGGCLADDMGLGKTVQLLALLLDRKRAQPDAPPSLVVVPKSLLFNWAQECERFTPKLRVLEYSGLERAALRRKFDRHDMILTTYGMLRRDVLELKERRFDYIVLDEAQAIKNSGSQVAKAARLLQANHRLALSGTPIENHLGDLWSIFEFLNPGMLGRSSVFRGYAANDDDAQGRRLLAQGLKPFILRRTKQQVASELPEKLEQTIHCKMGKDQRRQYEEMRDHYRDSLLGLVRKQGINKSRMHVLEALLRLRQVACHPGLLDAELRGEPSAKFDVLLPHLEELIEEKHKSLVFSQFTSLLSIVRQHFDERGIKYEYLDGQTRDRKERVERFQNDPDCPVFLISLKAGGLGLNLTAAEYVFLLDPWWNPAVEAQAIDRAHRVGQTRRVFAYRLICQDTVEEKIAELQGRKRALADAILTEDGGGLRDLSTDDLELLLS
ncbi:MAG: SNF2-related protein [Planctomycetaceae bacterium]